VNEEKILSGLRDAIVNLDIGGIKSLAQEAVDAGIPAFKAVVDGMAKGMEVIGQRYEAGDCFLAELIVAGEAMKEGMTVLEPHLSAGDVEVAGKCVIGTVRGDLHDIGKNIFVTFLKSANFDVLDLGVDVSAARFIEAVEENDPDIVAMSALLTTTMVEMEGIVDSLKATGLREKVKVIIGGAPITAQYTEKIGADASARDAIEGVRTCVEWMKAD